MVHIDRQEVPWANNFLNQLYMKMGRLMKMWYKTSNKDG